MSDVHGMEACTCVIWCGWPQAVPGDTVRVKVGGSFTFSDTDIQHPLMFFAGGIGITPIMSMLKHAMDLSADAGNMQGAVRGFLVVRGFLLALGNRLASTKVLNIRRPSVNCRPLCAAVAINVMTMYLLNREHVCMSVSVMFWHWQALSCCSCVDYPSL